LSPDNNYVAFKEGVNDDNNIDDDNVGNVDDLVDKIDNNNKVENNKVVIDLCWDKIDLDPSVSFVSLSSFIPSSVVTSHRNFILFFRIFNDHLFLTIGLGWSVDVRCGSDVGAGVGDGGVVKRVGSGFF